MPSIIIDVWPVNEAKRIALGVASDGGIVCAVPVVGETILDLVDLAWQTLVVGDGGGDRDGIAEGIVFRSPCDSHGRRIRHNDRTVKMIGVNIVERACIDEGKRCVTQSDIVFLDCTSGSIVFGDDVAKTVPDIMGGADR